MYKSILYLAASEIYYTRGVRNALRKVTDNLDCFFFNDKLILPGFYQLHPYYMSKLLSHQSNKVKSEKIHSFINSIKLNKYDIILVNNILEMPYSFFEKIKQLFKNVPIISYNWSSIKKYNYLPYQDCFTKIYSFDPIDCKENNFIYLPLFYLNDFENIGIGTRKQYDISFLGAGFSPDRIEFFTKLVESGKLNGLREYFYLHGSSRKTFVKTLLKNPYLSKYLYRSWLSENEVLNIYASSYTMIDHPMSIQSGLTFRTFETLGAGLDIYTTNKEIIHEPFYNPNRIHLINRDLSDFEFNTVDKTTPDTDWQKDFKKYSIDSWIKTVLTI